VLLLPLPARVVELLISRVLVARFYRFVDVVNAASVGGLAGGLLRWWRNRLAVLHIFLPRGGLGRGTPWRWTGSFRFCSLGQFTLRAWRLHDALPTTA